MTRVDPPVQGDERSQLLAYLDYQRETLRLKASGLDAEQWAMTHPPSDMTIGGMVKHLAFVEHWWLRCVFHGEEYAEPWASVDWDSEPDWEWRTGAEDGPALVWTLYDATIADVDGAIAGVDLDRLSIRPSRRVGELFSLRWILLHLIEEYARHNGHADLIREALDGQTGE